MIRRIGAAMSATLLVALGTVPAYASAPDPGTITQNVIDASAVAFSLRPTDDAGGSTPLAFYIGYADSNVSSPDPAADGQASWYNLNLAEAAAFQPWERCTPEKNLEATQYTAEDIAAWGTDYITAVMAKLQKQEQPSAPLVPGPRHACSERFAGFAQSRFPSTSTIPERATDNYLDKPAAANSCRQDPASAQCNYYKQYWPAFHTSVGKLVQDGSFSAAATDKPSQDSEAVLIGAGDGTYVSIGSARSTTSARMEGDTLISEATETMRDVCVMRAATTCALRIDQITQYARVKIDLGRTPVITRQTTILGVKGAGSATDITASDLHAEQGAINLSGYFGIKAVADSHTCDPGQSDELTAVADTGGLLIAGAGPPTTEHTPNGDVTIPGGGGGLMIGGACARARLDRVSYSAPVIPDFTVGAPAQTITIPGGPVVLGTQFGKVRYGPPTVITKQVQRVYYRRALAWRTAPYWASVLGAFLALFAVGYVFRTKPAVAPATRAANRFARQFLRG